METTYTLEEQKIQLINETGALKDVIIGFVENFHDSKESIEIVNQTQANYYNSLKRPKKDLLRKEFSHLKNTLESYGVTVLVPEPCPPEAGVPDSLTPRDIGFVIGNKFFISNMVKKSRQNEIMGIRYILDRIQKENVVRIPKEIFIEGGDVIVDNGHIFVGISQRTKLSGYYFLKSFFEKTRFKVIPVFLKQIEEGEDCLHLDCVFNPVGEHNALIYSNGIKKIPTLIKTKYNLIEINKNEQSTLGTNVLSISPKIVFSRSIHDRINKEMNKLGITVVPIVFDQAPKTGGSLRCCSLPLVRE